MIEARPERSGTREGMPWPGQGPAAWQAAQAQPQAGGPARAALARWHAHHPRPNRAVRGRPLHRLPHDPARRPPDRTHRPRPPARPHSAARTRPSTADGQAGRSLTPRRSPRPERGPERHSVLNRPQRWPGSRHAALEPLPRRAEDDRLCPGPLCQPAATRPGSRSLRPTTHVGCLEQEGVRFDASARARPARRLTLGGAEDPDRGRASGKERDGQRPGR